MKKRVFGVICAVFVISLWMGGCGAQKTSAEETSDHLTVYVWDNNLIKDVAPYIEKQFPDQKIEFIAGNNNVDLYNYLEKHNELPDIITTRRFSEKDAEALQPYLLDLGAYDIVSEYYPYALQYYAYGDGAVKWLPVCGIPETIIANKTIFDQYGLELPKNYAEFAACCKKLHDNGVKPYTSELAQDWAAHSLLQGAAVDQFSSIEGIKWRNSIELSGDERAFTDAFWKQVFTEVNTFMKDTYLTSEDLDCTIDMARQSFVRGEAAMFRGTPSVMEYLKSNMDSELVRIPYFSQTSDASWIYTYPSLNIALNSRLEENEGKLELAMQVLECFLSDDVQKRIADGDEMISYNVHVPSSFDGMTGVEKQIENNAFYIRYASNGSFSGSLQAVNGLLSGRMDETQAYEAFRKEVCSQKEEAPSVIEFQKHYGIGLNDTYGREAASAILTTVRKELKMDLAFSSYYYYTSSIYEGSCTEKEANMMIAQNDGSALWPVSLNGAQVKELVSRYLAGTDGSFHPTDLYGLPIASGMKLILEPEENQFKLKEIEVEGQAIEDGKTYRVLLTNDMNEILQQTDPELEVESLDAGLADTWTSIIARGQQPCAPEDYISVEE